MATAGGQGINLPIERGPVLGPVFEVTVESVEQAKIPPGEEWLRGCEG